MHDDALIHGPHSHMHGPLPLLWPEPLPDPPDDGKQAEVAFARAFKHGNSTCMWPRRAPTSSAHAISTFIGMLLAAAMAL